MTNTTTLLTNPIQLTDTFGIPTVEGDEIDQPLPGSLLMVGGLHGVAWQRHFSDGKWHSTTGATRSFRSLLGQRNVVLVYNATPRESRDDG